LSIFIYFETSLQLLVGSRQRLYNALYGPSLIQHTMVLLEEHMLEFISRSAEQTQRLGARLGTLLQGGDVICLEGPLGSGKTCLAQGIGRGWGAQQPLVSPSFVLVREYARPEDDQRLYHVDLYRISGPEEAWRLGVDEFLGSEYGISVIEWAGRAKSLVPSAHLWIRLGFVEPGDLSRRHLWFSAHGRRHEELLREFRHLAFGA
jgi:tRNA threonylcarbamoyladenosine biosynthesis protein TsaE